MGKLQNEDFKTEAELVGLGATKASLLNDTKIYLTGLSKTLDDAILDQDFAGAGGVGGNLIINGGFDINQRRQSSYASLDYCFDRWVQDMATTSSTITRQLFTLGQIDVPNEPKYYFQNVVTSGSGANDYAIIQQRIVDVRRLAGRTVTLSFWAKANTNLNMSTEFTQFFGSGGSPSASVDTIGVQKHSLTTTWTKFTKTVTIPSIAGKTLGTIENNFTALYFWFDAGSTFNSRTDSLGNQSGTFQIANVKIEYGAVSTDFRLAGIDLIEELSICRKYFTTTGFGSAERISELGYAYLDSNTLYMHIPLPNQMRTAPSVSFRGTANTDYGIYNSVFVFQTGFAFGVNYVENKYVQVACTKAGHGLTGGSQIFLGTVTPSGGMWFSAEL